MKARVYATCSLLFQSKIAISALGMTDIISLMFASALFYTLQLSVPAGGVMSQKLHNHMTKREIRHYFGVDNHDKVPEYDISHPYQSNDQGEFITYSMYSHTRNKRDIEPQASPFYIMDAFGTKLHLKLKRNDHLLAPGMTVLRRNSDGTTTIHPTPANTFYLGQVASDPKSIIAVSNHGGLTGMVKTSRNTLFVHPLPAHLAKHVTSNRDVTPHLVYRRTLKQSDVGYEMLEGGKGTDLGKTVDTKHLGSNSKNDESDRSKYRTLKVGYLYPRYLADKYSQGYLSVLGGVENYLALVANIVAGFFQDHTVGETKITYVLTSISMINPEEYGFKESEYIGHKLNMITAELKRQNVPYDVFSYVSNQNAQSGGIASLHGICKQIIGNVNNDIGLQTAQLIAHETAHNMLIGHDSGECAKGYIMSSNLPNGVHAIEWSPCSRNALQAFLADRERSECLDDGITENDTVLDSTFRNTLPGRILDGDKQCESLYAAGFKRIEKHQCAALRCEKHGVMLSNLAVVMDGTSCIPGMWCIKGLCQSSGVVWSMNKDYWTDWGHDYSQCTRSCGGGVQFVTRHCTHPNPGSKYCQGQSRKYRICNPLACPANGWRFRDQQCADRIPNSRAYLARPYVGCGRLFCRIGNSAQSKGIVLDGTRCTVNKDDTSVCLHGRCRSVGCDNVLDSTVEFDRCGVCGGNGSTCKIEFKYAGVPDAYGPESATLIAELLPGTTEASFYMATNTKNYIGVQNATGNYLVGGHLGGYQSINAAGTVIELHHQQTGRSKDSLFIAKENSTNAVLRVMYIKKEEKIKSEVLCKYFAPPKAFKWDIGSWSSCSLTCASGTRTRTRRCIRMDNVNNVIVSSIAGDDACPKPIPQSTEKCNIQPCKAKWGITEWSACTKTCGQGQQNRTIGCLEEVTKNNFGQTDHGKCSDSKKPTDPTTRACNAFPCPMYWNTGNWSKCSTVCGVGKTERIVSCMRINELGVLITIDDTLCRHLQKPAAERNCTLDQPCAPPSVTAEITACRTNPCLNGASCSDNGDRIQYTCSCSGGFKGDRCQVSPYYGIACFFRKSRGGIALLRDLRNGFDPKNTDPTIVKCADLAQEKGYRFFALGSNGRCFSGPDAGKNYFKHGTTREQNCVNGVGRNGVMYVYTFDDRQYEPLGCYEDRGDDRSLPILITNLRGRISWNDMSKTIDTCARKTKARDPKLKVFALQFYGECYSGYDGLTNHNKYGSRQNTHKEVKYCWAGVGRQWSNFVYKFKE
ncbi:A disintegrin and metalloproteinase with thrombospondin motifs 6-like isoform X2 [Montipora capricornis]|uniref:A disintegrin and metalloproteinase with thrombospondin motifs 6-like isoform X2 n=1 Tax=Montipora capricornis TaxID=246305 RepID=UPI0035F1CAFF